MKTLALLDNLAQRGQAAIKRSPSDLPPQFGSSIGQFHTARVNHGISRMQVTWPQGLAG